MNLIRDLDGLPDSFRAGAMAIGNFDGVHRGHAEIVGRLVAVARQCPGPAVVFTFDPHPAAILRPDRAPPSLTCLERKAELLCQMGADAVIAYPTDEALLGMHAREFFDLIVRRKLDARAMVEGRNFVFGRDRSGDVDRLRQFCGQSGMTLDVVDPVGIDGHMVSSSLIRSLVADGRVAEARQMLPGPYRIRGIVVEGARRGTGLGFPTANLDRIDTLLPSEGIYAGLGHVDGRTCPAAISLGPNPTFNEGRLKVEVHLIDFDGDIYARSIEVDFLARLRDIERFDSVERLIAAMEGDVEATRRIAAEYEP